MFCKREEQVVPLKQFISLTNCEKFGVHLPNASDAVCTKRGLVAKLFPLLQTETEYCNKPLELVKEEAEGEEI